MQLQWLGWCARRGVPRCLSVQTMVRHKAELEGTSWHIQPAQFVMQECWQTTIKILRVADYSGGGVQHSLQLICDRLRSFCIDSVAIINPWRHESMHKSCCRFFVKRPPNATKLAQPVETSCTGLRNMLLKGQIRRRIEVLLMHRPIYFLSIKSKINCSIAAANTTRFKRHFDVARRGCFLRRLDLRLAICFTCYWNIIDTYRLC